MMKNRVDWEKIGGIFFISFIVILISASMLYANLNNGNPMEEIGSEEVILSENIDNKNSPRSTESLPYDTETIPYDTEEEINESIMYAESILSSIDKCIFLGSQCTETSVIYTVGIESNVDKVMLKINLNNACYRIKYEENILDNGIEDVIILVVRETKPETVVMMCKNCEMVVDNL